MRNAQLLWIRSPSRHAFDSWIQQDDLPPFERASTAEACFESFSSYWAKETERPDPKYWRAIIRYCRVGFAKALTLAVLFQALQLIGPILIPYITRWVVDKTQPLYLG